MRAVSRTEWEVLNATADDWENLEQIYQAVRLWLGPNGVGLRGVADAVRRLAEDGLLEARLDEGEGAPDLRDLSYVWRAWFTMTTAGRQAWESSEFAAVGGESG